MAKKRELLPRVNDLTILEVSAEIVKSTPDYFPNLVERIQEENPWVAAVFEVCSEGSTDVMNVATTGALIYRFLEHQAYSEKRTLPVVSENIAHGVYAEKSWDRSHSKALEERLEKKNPHILDLIEKSANQSKDPPCVMVCGLMVYKLLESQAETDKLYKQIKMD